MNIWIWLFIALVGFIAGLKVSAGLLTRIGFGLVLLLGLALVLSNVLGAEIMAYWFGVSLGVVAVGFGVAIAGALVASLVRRLLTREPRQTVRDRDTNTIL